MKVSPSSAIPKEEDATGKLECQKLPTSLESINLKDNGDQNVKVEPLDTQSNGIGQSHSDGDEAKSDSQTVESDSDSDSDSDSSESGEEEDATGNLKCQEFTNSFESINLRDNGDQNVKVEPSDTRSDGIGQSPIDGDEAKSGSKILESESDSGSSESGEEDETDVEDDEDEDSHDTDVNISGELVGEFPEADFVDEVSAFTSDEEDNLPSKGPIKSKNEIDALPPVPKVDAVLEPHHSMLSVGVISSILGCKVIIDGSVKHNPLTEGSILWITETRLLLGVVDEIFGPVKNPFYIVRYNSDSEIPSGIHVGTAVSFVDEFSSHIINDVSLYKKGYDASGEYDEELNDEVEFSDDEKEAEYRKAQKQAKRGIGSSRHGKQDKVSIKKVNSNKSRFHNNVEQTVPRPAASVSQPPHVSGMRGRSTMMNVSVGSICSTGNIISSNNELSMPLMVPYTNNTMQPYSVPGLPTPSIQPQNMGASMSMPPIQPQNMGASMSMPPIQPQKMGASMSMPPFQKQNMGASMSIPPFQQHMGASMNMPPFQQQSMGASMNMPPFQQQSMGASMNMPPFQQQNMGVSTSMPPFHQQNMGASMSVSPFQQQNMGASMSVPPFQQLNDHFSHQYYLYQQQQQQLVSDVLNRITFQQQVASNCVPNLPLSSLGSTGLIPFGQGNCNQVQFGSNIINNQVSDANRSANGLGHSRAQCPEQFSPSIDFQRDLHKPMQFNIGASTSSETTPYVPGRPPLRQHNFRRLS